MKIVNGHLDRHQGRLEISTLLLVYSLGRLLVIVVITIWLYHTIFTYLGQLLICGIRSRLMCITLVNRTSTFHIVSLSDDLSLPPLPKLILPTGLPNEASARRNEIRFGSTIVVNSAALLRTCLFLDTLFPINRLSGSQVAFKMSFFG